MDNSGNPQDILVPPVEGVAGGGTAYGWNDGSVTGVRNLSPLKGSIDPSEFPMTDLVHVLCRPSSANVGPQEMPRHMEPINLLAARNERESVQIAIRPKVSWVSSGVAGTVQVQCSDLCSASGDRVVVGQSVTLRRVVPILGVPDALVPLDLPGETTAFWVSIDVLNAQPPGQYEGYIIITAAKPDTEQGSLAQCFSKADKYKLYREIQNCLATVGPVDDKLLDEEVERVKSPTTSLRRVLLSPLFSEFSDNGPVEQMDEDAISNLSVRVKIT